MTADDELVWQLREERGVSVKYFHTESWVQTVSSG